MNLEPRDSMPRSAQRVIADLRELAELTSTPDGAQRVAWGPVWAKAREWFKDKVSEIGLAPTADPAGNNWVTLSGESDKTVIVAGHLDSVPSGGWLDGSLGVTVALEALRRYARGSRPPVTLKLVDWADEEGARFGRSLLGSSAFAGTHSIAADRVRTDKDGIRLEDALRRCGVEIDRFPEAGKEQRNAAAYLELHIEQGPVLERLGLPLGVVLGTKGVERHLVTFLGQEAHSGSTPMKVRRDALAAAAKLALEIRAIAGKHPDAVSTIGSVKTFPGIVTAVVGRCEAALDQRDLDAGVLAQMFREAREASERFATEEKCTVEWSRIWSIEPIKFHPVLLDLCEQAVQETAGRCHRLPSGPLHDAAEVARAGIPTVMMFVQSLQGISHNKIENTLEDHLELSVIALDRLASKAVEWIQR
jgi:N-carbamoyl-L-amino-acid hydrolase